MFKNIFKNAVILTKGERNGIIGLLIILFILIIIRFLLPVFNKRAEEKELQNFEKEKKEYLALLPTVDSAKSYNHSTTSYTKTSKHYSDLPEKVISIEINKADTSELMKLPGIGTTFSRRILKYRNLLGGFYSKQQLSEVYGFTGELLGKISPNIYIDTIFIHKLNINNDDFKAINAHPYISFEQTRAIFNLRHTTKGKIGKDILKESGIFDSLTLNKLEHYLIFK